MCEMAAWIKRKRGPRHETPAGPRARRCVAAGHGPATTGIKLSGFFLPRTQVGSVTTIIRVRHISRLSQAGVLYFFLQKATALWTQIFREHLRPPTAKLQEREQTVCHIALALTPKMDEQKTNAIVPLNCESLARQRWQEPSLEGGLGQDPHDTKRFRRGGPRLEACTGRLTERQCGGRPQVSHDTRGQAPPQRLAQAMFFFVSGGNAKTGDMGARPERGTARE